MTPLAAAQAPLFSHQETFLKREAHIHRANFALSDNATEKVKKTEADHLTQSREAAAEGLR
ncbi:hypothetical protein P4S70_25645 [Enterovibrio sp. Hal110]